MADFKVNKELSSNITGLRQAAHDLEMEVGKADISLGFDDLQTLPTAKKVIAQHAAIKDLLRLYKALVAKDANDLSAMIDDVEKMDNAIAASHSGQ